MTFDDLRPGLRYTETVTVTELLAVPAMAASFASLADMPPVFATAYMVVFVEWTCIRALRPYMAPHQRTVGTHIDMSHVAATPVGMRVTAEVELLEVAPRRLRFRVECRDEAEVIGRGFHERGVIDAARFLERVRRKGAEARTG